MVDGLAVIAVFAVALSIGAAYHRIFVATGAPWAFGQTEFAAAVAQACGHGFIDIPAQASPNLLPFLNVQRDTFSCDELPASLEPLPPNLTQRLYRYLMSSVALLWKWQGAISWSGVGSLSALLFALTAVAAYFLFRLGVGPLLAAAAALLLAVSPNQLGMIVYLRDYAKAPFLLGLMALLGLFVSRRMTPRSFAVAAAAYGLVLGIGFGFRNDLLITVLPFVVTVWLFHPDGPFRSLKVKAIATAVAAATFLVVAWPIIRGYEKGSNTGHVALLGLTSSFEPPLGVRGSLYEWSDIYDDGYASSLIRAYSTRMHGKDVSYLERRVRPRHGGVRARDRAPLAGGHAAPRLRLDVESARPAVRVGGLHPSGPARPRGGKPRQVPVRGRVPMGPAIRRRRLAPGDARARVPVARQPADCDLGVAVRPLLRRVSGHSVSLAAFLSPRVPHRLGGGLRVVRRQGPRPGALACVSFEGNR